MTVKPIRSDEDLRRAFRRLEKIFQAEEGTAQAGERDVLVTLIEDYENEHRGVGPAGPKRRRSSADSPSGHRVFFAIARKVARNVVPWLVAIADRADASSAS